MRFGAGLETRLDCDFEVGRAATVRLKSLLPR